ncbi:MAG TPA: gas vesicle protein GvpO [Solirubrobacteraceae bacterium]
MAEQRKGSARRNGMSGREAIERVRRDLPQLLGRPIEAVLGLERDDGRWKVTVQVVELSRIPSTTDILGSYEVTLDEQGEVVGYRRNRRYHRNQTDEE